MYAVIVVKAAYIIFNIVIGMVNDTSKDKMWSIGSKESAVGQGKAIQSGNHGGTRTHNLPLFIAIYR